MISKKWKTRLLLPAVLVTTLFATGCVAQDQSADEVVTVVWWDRMDTDGQKATIADWIEGFEAANPNIKIERTYVPPGEFRQTVLTAAAGGSAPDIILYDTIDTAGYAEAGVIADISAYFDARADKANFVPGILDGARYQGGLYQVPYNVQLIGLWSNNEIQAEAGFKLPRTLDELSDAMESADKAGYNGLAAAFATPFATYTFTPILYTLGGSYDNLDSPEGLAALEYVQQWFVKGWVPLEAVSTTVLEAIDPFLQGRSAFGMNGTWMGGSINSDASLAAKIVAVPFPGKDSSSPGNSLATSNGASILEASANKDAAWKVIEWITGKERSLLLSQNTGALSPRDDVLIAGSDLVEKNAIMKVFSQELARALPRPSTPQWVVIEDAITTMVQSVAVGDAEPRDALKTAAAIISEALKK